MAKAIPDPKAYSIGSTDPDALQQIVPLDSILAVHAKGFSPSDPGKDLVGVDWFVNDDGRSVSGCRKALSATLLATLNFVPTKLSGKG